MKRNVTFQDAFLEEELINKILQFTNCRLFFGDELGFHDLDLWVLNGKVLDAKKAFYDLKRKSDIVIDCQGLIVSPGFIDIQVNGAFGVDFSAHNLSVDDVGKVANGLLKHGVTAFCPTIISSDKEIYQTVLPKLKKYSKMNEVISLNSTIYSSAKILGAHLEGPFISREKSGCHPQHCVKETFNADGVSTVESQLHAIYGDFAPEDVALITLAPELPGALEAIAYLTKTKGVKVSLGHSSACLNTGLKAIKAGATSLTHLFNAMPPYHHRRAGLIGLLAAHYDSEKENHEKTIYYGIIADGVHTDDVALRLAHSFNFKGMILVTDCISATGLPNGLYSLGDIKVEVNGMTATIQDSNVMAGSVSTMPYCISNFVRSINCRLDEALQCATWKPACFLEIDNHKGCLRSGCDADFVVLRENTKSGLEVCASFIAGVRRYLNK